MGTIQGFTVFKHGHHVESDISSAVQMHNVYSEAHHELEFSVDVE